MLKEVPFAHAMGAVMAVSYVVCAALVVLAPDFFRGIADSWVHGYDLSAIPAGGVTFGGFLWGLITAVGLSWLFGYLLAWTYNKLAK